MTEVVGRKKRMNNAVNKFCVAKDEICGEEVGRATQALSASSVASMAIMQRSANRLSASNVIRSGISQKIVDLQMKEKRWDVVRGSSTSKWKIRQEG